MGSGMAKSAGSKRCRHRGLYRSNSAVLYGSAGFFALDVQLEKHPSAGELLDKRWILIEVTVPNPSRSYHEIRNPRPTQVDTALRPSVKVHLLATLQFASAELVGSALVLNRLLSRPADHERTCRSGDEIWVFPGTLYRVEDDLQIFSDGDADQSGLRDVSLSERTQDTEFALRQEPVEMGLCHREYYIEEPHTIRRGRMAVASKHYALGCATHSS